MKNIFKILCIALLGVFMHTSTVFGQEECPELCSIAEEGSPGLEKYLEDLALVTQNIMRSQAAAEAPEKRIIHKLDQTIGREKRRARVLLNRILNYNAYFCEIDVGINMHISTSIPYPIQRDIQRLQWHGEQITSYIESSVIGRKSNAIIANPCAGVQNCPFSGEVRVADALATLYENNNYILQSLYGSLIDKSCTSPEVSPQLVGADFIQELKQNYNRDVITACNMCKGKFLERNQELFQKIPELSFDYSKGIQEWKDAWSMLRGIFDFEETADIRNEENEEGRTILSIEHDNRERYNGWGFSTQSTRLHQEENSFLKIQTNLNDFNESLRQNFEKSQSVPISRIPQVQDTLNTTQRIDASIRELYETQLPYAFMQDTLAEETKIRMIRIHKELTRSIEVLTQYVSKAEEVCDRQGTGLGQCRYR